MFKIAKISPLYSQIQTHSPKEREIERVIEALFFARVVSAW